MTIPDFDPTKPIYVYWCTLSNAESSRRLATAAAAAAAAVSLKNFVISTTTAGDYWVSVRAQTAHSSCNRHPPGHGVVSRITSHTTSAIKGTLQPMHFPKVVLTASECVGLCCVSCRVRESYKERSSESLSLFIRDRALRVFTRVLRTIFYLFKKAAEPTHWAFIALLSIIQTAHRWLFVEWSSATSSDRRRIRLK